MKKFDQLIKVALNEAPISAYIKVIGSKIVNPAAYARGGAKVAGAFSTSTQSTKQALQSTGRALSNTGKWLASPGLVDNKTEKSTAKKSSTQPQETYRQKQKEYVPYDFSKLKKSFIQINNTRLDAKYIRHEREMFPVFQIKGIPWAKSIIIEPTKNNRATVYMFKEKNPSVKKKPVTIRPGVINYSGVQNIAVINIK